MVDLSLSKLLDNGTIKINSKKSSIKSPIAIKYKKKMSVDFIEWWCPRTESNREPIDYKSTS